MSFGISLQREALATAVCERVFEDRASDAHTDRPSLAQAIAYVRHDNVLVVWMLDRLGCYLPHLIDTVHELDRPELTNGPPGTHKRTKLEH